MKIRTISLVGIMMGISVAGMVYFIPEPVQETPSDPTHPKAESAATATIAKQPSMGVRAMLPPEPVVKMVPRPEKTVVQKKSTAQTQPKDSRKQNADLWKQHARKLDRLLNQFANANNPEQRKRIIQSISCYVRMDTLSVLDWAMSLTDPDEKRMALEQINRYALNGIGAHIEMDESGIPKIKKTTLLGALEESGLAETGDYISGMINADGTHVSFKDMSMRDIITYLRGKPGTETLLLMERISPDGIPYAYNLPIQRRMIIVQPPQE